jgi:diguanylate cyclase (GGDEF)-like protein
MKTNPATSLVYVFTALAAAAAAGLGALGFGLGGLGGAALAALLSASISAAGLYLWKARATRRASSGGKGAAATRKDLPPDRLDALTGLANMNGLYAWFEENAANLARDKKAIIVMAADLANFDELQRSRGEELANAVLKEAAKRVGTFIGDNGIAARIDGEEFAAIATIVPSRSLEFAAEQAGKLAEMLQRPVELPTGVIWIGGSVGVATGSPLKGPAVFERSRIALKKAKQIGRGHYFVDSVTED